MRTDLPRRPALSTGRPPENRAQGDTGRCPIALPLRAQAPKLTRMNRRAMRFAILLVTAVALACVWLWLDAPAPDQRFEVLGVATTLERSVAPRALPPSRGLFAGEPISNAFVETDEPPEPGRFWWQGTFHDSDSGQLVTRRARFDPGPWTEVQHELVHRVVESRIGAEVANYRVQLRGAIRDDGSQWFFSTVVSGTSTAPAYYSARPALRYLPQTRTLTVAFDELFGNRCDRYEVEFTIGTDGSVQRSAQ